MATSDRSQHQLDKLIAKAIDARPVTTAVVHPVDHNSLVGAIEAKNKGLIEPVLVGPKEKILAQAKESELSLEGMEIIDVAHSHEAATRACQLVQEGRVECIMKGGLSSGELLSAIVSRSSGIRTERRLSHAFVFDIPQYHKPLIICDAAINIQPDLDTKRDIVQSAIDLCRALGTTTPKVAILAAIEKVKASMPSTIDAAALCKMADRGQIKNGILDGPLAFDNAISLQAAVDKHIESPVSGEADILIAPDLEAANMLAKQLMYLANATSAGIALGAKVPVILTSRSETGPARLASCALASHLVHQHTLAAKD